MSDLVVVGFDNAHTAFLAAAALSRMEDELDLDEHDVAVVCRQEDGEVSVREAVEIAQGPEHHKAFWQTLVGLLLPAACLVEGNAAEDVFTRLSSIGVPPGFTSRVAKTVCPGTAAVMVLATGRARERIIGVLRGFKAHIDKTPLCGEDRRQWIEQLSGAPASNGAVKQKEQFRLGHHDSQNPPRRGSGA